MEISKTIGLFHFSFTNYIPFLSRLGKLSALLTHIKCPNNLMTKGYVFKFAVTYRIATLSDDFLNERYFRIQFVEDLSNNFFPKEKTKNEIFNLNMTKVWAFLKKSIVIV